MDDSGLWHWGQARDPGRQRLARLVSHLPPAADPAHGIALAETAAVLGGSNLLNRALTSTPPVADHADGIYITDERGKRYLDFGSGIAVTNIGQNVEIVKETIKAQLDTATFIYNGHFSNTPAETAAGLLLKMCPSGGSMAQGRVLFCNSGSEGNEIALKLCRQYHNERGHSGKYKVISRFRAYHGNTLAAAALSDRPTWTNQFEPYLNRDAFPVDKMACPNTYRQSGLDAHELEEIILKEGPDTVSAFIAEPVSGTSLPGSMPPPEYFQEVRRICDKHDVLFIADEVIMGLGRTGKNFGIQHFGIEPDLITTAKGLCAGYGVLAAVMVSGPVCEAIAAGSGLHTQGHTHTANPLSCAAAAAVLEYIVSENVVANAQAQGLYLERKLNEVLGGSPIVGDIRGVGMFWGVEFVEDKDSRRPFHASKNITARIVKAGLEAGIMLVAGSPGCADGINGDQLQLSPPLVMTKTQIDDAVSMLAAAIETVRLEVAAEAEIAAVVP